MYCDECLSSQYDLLETYSGGLFVVECLDCGNVYTNEDN